MTGRTCMAQSPRFCGEPATRAMRALDGSVGFYCDPHAVMTLEAGAVEVPTDDPYELDRRRSCHDPQCQAFNHTCPGCGNFLHGDNLCMVSACELE